MVYELINPSDPYTFTARDKETAALVIGHLSLAFGAETEYDTDENRVPIFIFGGVADYDFWYREEFGRSPAEGFEAKKRDVAEALLSFALGGFTDRQRYEAALKAIDDPEKRERFIAKWHQRRTSLNDIQAVARSVGERLMEVTG